MGRGSVVVGVLYISWERKEEKVCGEGECSCGSTVHLEIFVVKIFS